MNPLRRPCSLFAVVAGIAAILPFFTACAAEPAPAFSPAEVRSALSDLARLLAAPDTTAWVEAYTTDAMFVGADGPAVEGRPALLAIARKMKPLAGMKITPLRVEGNGSLAYVYAKASWVESPATGAPQTIRIRSLLMLRKEADGKWRVAQELVHADPDPAQ